MILSFFNLNSSRQIVQFDAIFLSFSSKNLILTFFLFLNIKLSNFEFCLLISFSSTLLTLLFCSLVRRLISAINCCCWRKFFWLIFLEKTQTVMTQTRQQRKMTEIVMKIQMLILGLCRTTLTEKGDEAKALSQ